MSLATLAFDSQSLVPLNELNVWTYTSVRAGGNVTRLLPRCARYPGRIAEAAPTGGVYTRADARFTFGFGDLGDSGIEPKPGDLIQKAGGRALAVLDAVEAPLMTFHKVTARDLVLAYDLRDSATVKRSVPSSEGGGVRVRNPVDIAAGVPCRLQPVEMRPEYGEDRVEQFDAFRVYLGQPLALRAGDTIAVGGTEYEVTRQADISRIDTLTTADVERRR